MTSRLTRKPWGKDGHVYDLDGKRAPGVTSILGSTIDKPGLRYWYAHQAVLWAMTQDPQALQDMPPKELKRLAGQAPNLIRDDSAREGKTLHAYAEALAADQEIEPSSELAARAELIADFLNRYRLRVLASEVSIWHETLRYAGTLDVVADLWIDGTWQRWLLDYKTGTGVYPEAVMQASAYRYATHAVLSGQDVPMAEVQRVGIVHVRPEGWQLIPVAAEREAFEGFVHALHLWRFLQKGDDLISPALVPPALEEGPA